jgi:hypothetical protein
MDSARSNPVIALTPDWVAVVREKVEGLRFGTVQIVVHDGRVTQIERTERTRLDAPTSVDFSTRR